jgi:hypothetical protein
MSNLRLKEDIINEVHVNKEEHRENYFYFTFLFVFYGSLGITLGKGVDFVSKKVRNGSNSRVACAGILLLQLTVIASVFYALMHTKFYNNIAFDDWLMATWKGFVFSLSFFTAQKSIQDLIQVIFETRN